MIYRKMIKNVLLSQYYDNCIKINEYFNRKIPVGISMFLSVMCQISGGLLLTLFGISGTRILDGNLIFIYFVFLAWFQSFLQARKDFDTYDSLYETTMFVYGYNNKKSIVANAVSYGILNIIGNPMVFLPAFVFPLFWFKNLFVILSSLVVPSMLYLTVFLKLNNKLSQGYNNRCILEIFYVFKSIIVTVIMTFLLPYALGKKQIYSNILNSLNEQITENIRGTSYAILFWMPFVVLIITLVCIIYEYSKTSENRCEIFGEFRSCLESKWVYWLSQICRDIKVKSDLLIVARRKDLWKDNPELAFVFPNTILLFMAFSVFVKNSISLPINPVVFLIVSLIFEIVVLANFIFKNISFIMFHNSELENIDLYKMRGKDTFWLLGKKIKLMCYLMVPAIIFENIFFIILGAYWVSLKICILFIVTSMLGTVITSYISLCWMHSYRQKYINYEEFLTKKISLSMKNQFSSIPLFLFCVPFTLYLFDMFMQDMIISNSIILKIMIGITVINVLFSSLVCLLSIRTWKKR